MQTNLQTRQRDIWSALSDGLHAFYTMRSDGVLGTKLRSGFGYTKGWSAITAVNIDTPPVAVTFGDGVRRVGTDIPAGTYRQTSTQSACYWERLSGFSGSLDDIIANEFTNVRQIVIIKPSDAGFESVRCGSWSTLLKPLARQKTAAFVDGTYLVNHELAPGSWRNSDSSDGCYWERRAGFSGEFEEIIANQFTNNQTIVTISSGDTGFMSERCGTWTYLSP